MKEIVIELNDTTYESLTSPSVVVELATIRNLVDAVLHGKVLPKGHGELKDASLLRENYHTVYNEDIGIFEDVVNIADIDLAETLVEADKGEEE